MEELIATHYEDKNNYYLCPTCDSEVRDVRYLYSYNNEKFYIYRCRKCSFLFGRPFFIQDLGGRRLDSIHDAELFGNTLLRALHEKINIGREIYYVNRFLKRENCSLLDIGCGTGWTTHVWVKSGFHVTGLEPSKSRGRIASERYGIKVKYGYLENLTGSDVFDVVLLRHVVEHFEKPFDMLVKASSLLHPGGILVVVVPNINCIGRYIFRTNWTWGTPFHCNFFSPSTARRLLQRAGFEVLKTYQSPSPMLYPESFERLFSGNTLLSAKAREKMRLLSLLPFAPLVLLGILLGLSETVTVIARVK